MKYQLTASILVLLSLFACAPTIKFSELEGKKKEYIVAVRKMTNSFSVDKKLSKTAWDRGSHFIKQYSRYLIQKQSEVFISTYRGGFLDEVLRPGEGIVNNDKHDYVYEMYRETKGDKVEFKVKCLALPSPKANETIVNFNEKILAYYVISGNLDAEFIDKEID